MENYNLKDFFIKKKFFFMFILVCLTYFVSIFSGPVVEDTKQIEYNVRNIYLPFGLGFSVSSDSGNYMRIANNPTLMYEEHREVNGRILVPGSMGQSRPGALITVHLLSKPINYIFNYFNIFSDLINKKVKESLDLGYQIMGVNQTIEDSIPNFIDLYPTYISFLLLNTLVIFFSFFFYCKSIGLSVFKISSYSQIALWIGIFFIINDLTKKYFVSPNPGIFNLFAAASTLFACQLLKKGVDNKNYLIFFSFFFGFFNLFYEVFICPYLTFVIIFFKVEFIDKNRDLKSVFFDYKIFILSLFLFILPYFLWFFYNEFFRGGFFHYGVDENPGFSVYKSDPFSIIETLFFKAWFGIKIASLSTFPVVILFFSACIYNLFYFKKSNFFLEDNLFLIGVIYTILIVFLFSSYGAIGSRHTIGVILIFLPFIASRIKNFDFKKEKIYIYTFFLFSLIYAIYVARKTFPYGEGILLNPFI